MSRESSCVNSFRTRCRGRSATSLRASNRMSTTWRARRGNPFLAARARAARPAPAPAHNAGAEAEEFVEDNFEDEPAPPPRGGAPRGGSAPNEDDIPF